MELIFTHIVNINEENQNKALTDILREAINRMIPKYESILEAGPAVTEEQVSATVNNDEGGKIAHPNNMILQGPPGTGKTYHTVLYAVTIIEGKSIDEIQKDGYPEVKKNTQNIETRTESPLRRFTSRMNMRNLLKALNQS